LIAELETLSERRLNRALLARQRLLERSPTPMTEVIEQMGCIQTQYAPSGYINLWSRVADFRRDALTEAIVDRTVIQATMMRVTIHMASAADYWPLTAAVRRSRREWFERVARQQIGDLDMENASAVAREILSDGPLRMDELTRRMGERGFPPPAARWAGLWIDLVRVPPSGTWHKRRADIYGLADQWSAPARDYSEGEGIELLVRRYLGAFGPARPVEIADWAGLPVAALSAAVAKHAPRRFRDEQGRELVDLPDAPLPDEAVAAPVRFLPVWDATLLVHARRTQILPEKYRSRVFNTRTPHSINTFLVDGQVAGSWRYDKKLEFEPFTPLPSSVLKQVRDEASRLSDFHS
jgi:hypothetical protein